MVLLSSWYVKTAFGASLIILLSDKIQNGDFGIDPKVLITYVVLTAFKFY
jgi:hypothetical protein